MRTLAWTLAASATTVARTAWAHGGGHGAAESVEWVLPLVLLIAALTGYLLGWRRLSQEGRAARMLGQARPLAFIAGILLMLVVLLPPFDGLADRSFAAHMVQHMVLMLAAPPPLVWGRPALAWLAAFPLAGRRQIGGVWARSRALLVTRDFLMRPLVVWMSASLALWFWHIPAAYDWALGNAAVHGFEHLCFFATSLAFWTLVLAPYRRAPGGQGPALLMVATFALHSGLLGALLTFAQAPLYRSYVHPAFGLTPLEEQQLAGLIMWVPAGAVYLLTAGLLFTGWLGGIRAYRPRAS